MTSVNVTTTKNTVTVSEGDTRIVTIKTQGPQGPSLPDGDKGDVTVSSNGTAISINNSAVTSAKIADGAIVDADINASAAIALTKLATGALPTAITVTSANISDLSIVDADISASAAISLSKLATGALPTAITVTSANISDLSIVNADINASAAIAGTKISPDFGSQNIVTTGTAATGALGVTGNLTVSGTVDGVDVATRDALFGGLTSSSGVLSNGVTATTQSASDNSTKVATTAYTDTAISNLINGAPAALDTLNELAAALNDDAAFSTTVTNSIATKMPLAGGQFTGNVTFSGTQTVDGRDLSVDGAKLDGIESGATADQTAAEIRTLVESASDSNVFTDADHSKLNGIEASATADQTAAEIKTLFNSNGLVNAQIDASAAIAGTKISPDFGSQNIVTTGDFNSGSVTITGGSPAITFTDNNNDPDYYIQNNNGALRIYDATNSADRFVVNTDGHIDVTGNLDIGAGLDVTGNITVTGTVDGRDVATDGTKLDGIETGATADQTKSDIDALGIAASTATTLATARTIAGTSFDGSANIDISYTNLTNKLSVGDGGLTQNNFTDALKTKLDGVETGATADQTASEIVALIADQTIAPSTIDMEDNEKIKLGTGDDLEIYHDPSSGSGLNYIKAVSGYMMIQQQGNGSSITVAATNVYLKNHNNNETFLYGVNNGSVDLYYDNSKKLETTSTGVKITGTGTNTVEINGTGGHELYSYHDSGGVGWATGASTNYGELLYLNESGSKIHLYAGGVERLKVDSSGASVTGNIAVSGTVDGVDIATRDTLFGGLTSSSGVLTNGVTATTQSASDNSTKVATTAYADTAVANLVDSAPGTLNTLNELAAALGDDPNFATTVTNSIATKMPLAGGEFTGNVISHNITPDTDSSRFLGSNGTRFSKVFADVYEGSGANLTNLPSQTDNNFTDADHSKLDGIESNATADQTASEIVALVADQTIAPSTIDMEDNEKIQLGTGDDLEIYHDGTHSYIKDTNSSATLNLLSTRVNISSSGNTENIAKFIENGAVELYYDNSKKFETTSDGIQVDGTATNLTIRSGTASGTAGGLINFKNVDGNGNPRDVVRIKGFSDGNGGYGQLTLQTAFNNTLYDRLIIKNDGNVQIPADNKRLQLGASQQLYLEAFSTYGLIQNTGNGYLYLLSEDFEFREQGTNDTLMKLIGGGAVELYHNNSKKFETISDGAKVTGRLQVTNYLEFDDSVEAYWGNSHDLQIYHDGTASRIYNTTGNLSFRSSSYYFNNSAGTENCLDIVQNGAVSLYYDNSKKFETTSSGATVTGALATTSLSATGGITGTGGNFILGDSSGTSDDRIKLGAGGDLHVYHDGTDTYVSNATGDLRLFSVGGSADDVLIRAQDDIELQPNNGEAGIKVIGDGAVELYFDNSKKLETTSAGVDVTGNVTFAGDSNTHISHPQADYLKITTGGNEVMSFTNASNIFVPDSRKLMFGDHVDLQIYHDGSNSFIKDSGTGALRILSNDARIINAASTEDMARFIEDGTVELYYDNSKKFETTSGGISVTGNIAVSGTVDGVDVAALSASVSGFMSNVVEDTSPQLGGNLDSNNQNILLPDSTGTNRIKFGTNEDLQIYHNGHNNKTYIGNKTSTDLLIENAGTNTDIVDDTGHYRARFIKDGAVELYHDNSKKFETTSAGVQVTGTLTFPSGNTINTGSSSGNLLIQGGATYPGGAIKFTGGTASETDHIRFYAGQDTSLEERMVITRTGEVKIPDNGKFIAGSSDDLQIYHSGSHSYIQDAGTGSLILVANNVTIQNAAQSENIFSATENGSVELYYDNSKKFETTSTGATVTGSLGIGTTSPSKKLEVNTGTASDGIKVLSDEISATLGVNNTGDNYARTATLSVSRADSGSLPFLLLAGQGGIQFASDINNERMRIASDGNVGIGKSSSSLDVDGSIFIGSGQGMNMVKSGSGGKIITLNRRTNVGLSIEFYRGSSVGSISHNNTSTAYNTTSDYRLKENVVSLSDAITRLKTLKPYRFNFIADKDVTVDGFIAHEVTAVPEAIQGEKDAVVTQAMVDNNEYEEERLGEIIPQGIDQSKLVPLLVAAVQELIGRVEKLEGA